LMLGLVHSAVSVRVSVVSTCAPMDAMVMPTKLALKPLQDASTASS
jgi:hypothetical protein